MKSIEVDINIQRKNKQVFMAIRHKDSGLEVSGIGYSPLELKSMLMDELRDMVSEYQA